MQKFTLNFIKKPADEVQVGLELVWTPMEKKRRDVLVSCVPVNFGQLR